jgi:hypothetical protein
MDVMILFISLAVLGAVSIGIMALLLLKQERKVRVSFMAEEEFYDTKATPGKKEAKTVEKKQIGRARAKYNTRKNRSR